SAPHRTPTRPHAHSISWWVRICFRMHVAHVQAGAAAERTKRRCDDPASFGCWAVCLFVCLFVCLCLCVCVCVCVCVGCLSVCVCERENERLGDSKRVC